MDSTPNPVVVHDPFHDFPVSEEIYFRLVPGSSQFNGIVGGKVAPYGR